MNLRSNVPAWGRLLALACMCALIAPARAQPRGKADKRDRAEPTTRPTDAVPAGDAKDKQGPVKTYDFTALDLAGRMRTPQLLYFLERANEELERASLERRSFIPHIVRSLDEEAL